MRALTVLQPYSWAIAHAGKRVENRGTKPPKTIVGGLLAIHAGKRILQPDAIRLRQQLAPRGIVMPKGFVLGAVESVVLVQGWVDSMPADHAQLFWFRGPHGWMFGEPQVLKTPVPCRGQQGVWVLPDDVEKRVREQLRGNAAA